jgi:hypothetical protein
MIVLLVITNCNERVAMISEKRGERLKYQIYYVFLYYNVFPYLYHLYWQSLLTSITVLDA